MGQISKQTRYLKTSVDIYFTADEPSCALCPLLETYARKQCRRTGEYIVNDKTFGLWCPLKNEGVIDYGTGEIIEDTAGA